MIYAIALAIASISFAQSKPALAKIYVGSEGLVHVVDATGKDTAVRKESNQAAVSAPKLSPDRHTAGWLIEQENCCTSYTIPTSLAIYRLGKKRLFGDGLMIYDWSFVDDGAQVALSTGTVHGMTSRHLTLYDIRSGRLLQEWNGDPDATPPIWAKDLKQ